MDTDFILTRCCWSGSVGNLATDQRGLDSGLRSGQDKTGIALTAEELMEEFSRHRDLRGPNYFDPNRATALVSASSRIIDTLRRAFSILYEGDDVAENIYIVFIRVPEDQRDIVHSAREVAEQCGMDDSDLFTYEFLFEYEIPREFVVHSVTVDTLLNRGLDLEQFWAFGEDTVVHPSTQYLTEALAATHFDHEDAWHVGLQLGFFAKCFGARAPSVWIKTQLPDEIGPRLERCDYYRIRFISELITDGFHESLVEWWLLDDEFVKAAYEVERMEEAVLDEHMNLDQKRANGNCSTEHYVEATERLEHRWEGISMEANLVGL